MRSPADLSDLFRARGLKITPQRQLIFRILHDDHSHPTAVSVYAAAAAEMPAISLRTVYQALNDLAAMGEIQLLDLGTGPVRFDPLVVDHHHLVCSGCGVVRDVVVAGVDELVTDEADEGFTIATRELVFRGVCAGCAQTT